MLEAVAKVKITYCEFSIPETLRIYCACGKLLLSLFISLMWEWVTREFLTYIGACGLSAIPLTTPFLK